MKRKYSIIISVSVIFILLIGACAGYNAAKVKSSMHKIVGLLSEIKENLDTKNYTEAEENFNEIATIHEELKNMKPLIGDKEKWDDVHDFSIMSAFNGADACKTRDDENVKKAIKDLMESKKKGHKQFIKK